MPLAERARQLAELSEVLRDAAQGRGGVAVVSGGIGCGRTELLDALRRAAVRAGHVVLRATGSRPERDSQGGVLGQLLRYADLPEDRGGALAQQLARVPGPGAGGTVPWPPDGATSAALHDLSAGLLRIAEQVPVLLCVDDVDLADSLSVHWIRRLVPHLRAAHIALVTAECTAAPPAHPPLHLHAELRRHPGYRRVVLEGLSPDGVATVLADSLGGAAARALAAGCHRITAGNPLLLRALVADQERAGAVQESALAAEPVVADAYADAVLGCLHRGGPAVLVLAQVLAVLDEAEADPGRLARLLEDQPATVAQRCRELEAAGILGGTRLRHPAARAVVLQSLSALARTDLHRRAAELLHDDGADASRIAPHLLAAAPADAPWAVAVLQEAAQRHLAADRIQDARACLGAAVAACRDDGERAALRAQLAATAWLLDPSLGARHFAELAAALRDGLLPGRHALALARHLLWYGRFDEAALAVQRAEEPAAGADPATGTEVRATRALLAAIHPPVLVPAAGTGGDPRIQAAAALSEVLARGPGASAVAAAEAALRGMRLGRSTSEWIVCAVTALLYAERTEAAGRWCRHWMSEARIRRVPLWEAEFSSLLAGIRRRQGDPVAARGLVEAALAQVPVEAWGVTLGRPLAHLIEAATDLGDHLAAAEHIAVPVPDAMFETRFGLHFLHARGRHLLAVGRADDALDDFTACADLMRRWGCDRPALVPWRTGAARAHLAWGDTTTAHALAQEQLALVGPLRTRTRGLTLRVLADTEYGAERIALLTEAVAVLRAAGDPLQTARALADLARAHLRAGRTGRARTGLATAARLAGRCGARSLAAALAGELETLALPGRRPGDERADRAAAVGLLSAAERRVAALAADGHSNKEIAQRLHITVSTVEQHLTRVFRKLGVRARRNLPSAIALDAGQQVAAVTGAAAAVRAVSSSTAVSRSVPDV